MPQQIKQSYIRSRGGCQNNIVLKIRHEKRLKKKRSTAVDSSSEMYRVMETQRKYHSKYCLVSGSDDSIHSKRAHRNGLVAIIALSASPLPFGKARLAQYFRSASNKTIHSVSHEAARVCRMDCLMRLCANRCEHVAAGADYLGRSAAAADMQHGRIL